MNSKYTEAFDSLKSDDNTKHKRTERILSAQNTAAETEPVHTRTTSVSRTRNRFFAGRRGVALLTTIAVFVAAIAISVPVGISIYNKNGLLNAISRLKDTFVDMDGIAAFGVWNAPDSTSKTPRITNVSYVKRASRPAADAPLSDDSETDNEDNDIIVGDWSDDERYDWESDYDWDPTKANVLIAINEDGSINEVIYERTNGRGRVRQDILGNAVTVYVSNGFTFVMYVDDRVHEFWDEINFAQEMRSPSGFHCHHESMQTVVIHNATGKVFALKDLFPQVSKLAGATNYTMQVDPFKDDFIRVEPLYGNMIPQWYNVIYDEQVQKIRYELVVAADIDAIASYTFLYNVRTMRRDKYGQQYLLEGYKEEEAPSHISSGIVNLPSYRRYDNTLIFSTDNGMMFGTDNRMYVFDDGILKVFGENFELRPVETDTKVSFEGVANEYSTRRSNGNDGIAYRLEGGYLYSMFGEVWKVDDDGSLHPQEKLIGSFPRYADDGYLMGGEIIAFVNTRQDENGISVDGKMVRIRFDAESGAPRAEIKHIVDASEISVRDFRMVVQQNENPYSYARGHVKYFLITVQNGTPYADYFGYGYNGGIDGLTRPITEPLVLSNPT